MDGERTSDAAVKCSATTRRTVGRAHRRYDSENKRRSSKSAATNEAAQRYKFYHPLKLHSHLVAQIKF